MGNVVNSEHKSALHLFRDNAMSMIELALQYTTLPPESISIRRMVLLRDQIKSFSMPTLVYFSKKWFNACDPVIETEIPEHDLDNYIARLKTIKLKLPENGNGVDVCDVIQALPEMKKRLVVELVHLAHSHAKRANIIVDESKRKKQKKKKPTRSEKSVEDNDDSDSTTSIETSVATETTTTTISTIITSTTTNLSNVVVSRTKVLV